MNQLTVGVVGAGYVGSAMVKFLSSRYDVRVYDKFKKYPPLPEAHPMWEYVTLVSDLDDLHECSVVFICVPTPSTTEGRCDTTIVESVIEGLQDNQLLVIKSTVEPGTTDYLGKKWGKSLVFSPEYCGESSYWSPFKFHTEIVETPFFIFGGHPTLTSRLVDFYMPIAGPTKTYRQTTAKAAEMTKYMENCFYAAKVAFCYEMENVCHSLGVDYNEVRELWTLDPRFSPMHTAVFSDNQEPFGGKCFPKDLMALVSLIEAKNYGESILKAVLDTNARLGLLRKARQEQATRGV